MHVENLTLAYDVSTPVVDALTLEVPSGQLTAIVGPNGSGKSTLLRGMSRLLTPQTGRVLLDGKDIHQLPARELARKLGVLPQGPVTPEGISVAELVSRGRHPHRGLFGRLTSADDAAIDEALQAVELTELRDRPVEQLSGGQRQRVWIAMVLAQGTQHLLLDEPTTYLDLAHAVDVMNVVHASALTGRTVVAVLHDLTLAAQYADHLVVMGNGQIAAQGSPVDVLTAPLLDDVFGLKATVVEVGGAPVVVPDRRLAG
ncbi:ABC transporter ATP-binding protein [Kribbella solani]|uniref:Iron complex transport system ATP-binding protein n=1 Tax=Kribbella solani TaxID=236067 RepID=A0A841E4K6_9ACTN|nr:ATP-binding cassette domain-containing protein [Kribbella solani]MBB5983870.1 iron complex transport system ATP-binding protein [Kribbella solani]MDX2968261.1 ABC transporter ATP-binding protein [Kribbella solani]MDX3003097.1 ABC transporter ATP-binding protein [Kribbella solani]